MRPHENLPDRHYIKKMAFVLPCALSRRLSIRAIFVSACLLLVFSQARSLGMESLFREEFTSLDNWRPLYFPAILKHSTYTIEKNGGESFLKAESDGSASAIVCRKDFRVSEYPMVRWRWKIMNVYQKVDPGTRSGDDYPIRIYIIFRYKPDNAGPLESLQYGIAKRRYGEYPPHSTLNYIWASEEGQKDVITSPYTGRAKLIALQRGSHKAGTWQTEEVNILSDYRKAFGTEPPGIASLAIMNDSDNTGQASVSYVDFIEVFRDGK